MWITPFWFLQQAFDEEESRAGDNDPFALEKVWGDDDVDDAGLVFHRKKQKSLRNSLRHSSGFGWSVFQICRCGFVLNLQPRFGGGSDPGRLGLEFVYETRSNHSARRAFTGSTPAAVRAGR